MTGKDFNPNAVLLACICLTKKAMSCCHVMLQDQGTHFDHWQFVCHFIPACHTDGVHFHGCAGKNASHFIWHHHDVHFSTFRLEFLLFLIAIEILIPACG